MQSPAFDGYVYKNDWEGSEWKSLRWAKERGIDLRGFVLELNGDRRAGAVLNELMGRIDSEYSGTYGNLDMASYYATRGKLDNVDVTVVPMGHTALHNACSKGYIGIVNALLAAGAEVDKAGSDGWTPL